MTTHAAHRAARQLRRKRLIWLWVLGGPLSIVASGIALYGTLLLLAEPLLWVRAKPQPSDAIVVLGGDGPRRAEKAAQLYRNGMAPRVFVAGDSDCLHIALTMANLGVPASVIQVECHSQNTWQNAHLSAPLLAKEHISSGLIVTSWYHTRRALACFRSLPLKITWLPIATLPDAKLLDLAMSRDGWAALLEYIKIVGYVLRYKIPPADFFLNGKDSAQAAQHPLKALSPNHAT